MAVDSTGIRVITVAIKKTIFNYSKHPYQYSVLFPNAEDMLSTNIIWQYGNIVYDPVKVLCLCFVYTVVSLHPTL